VQNRISEQDAEQIESALKELRYMMEHALATKIDRGAVGVRVTINRGHFGTIRKILEADSH
jgi:hypothetical protein